MRKDNDDDVDDGSGNVERKERNGRIETEY